MGVGTGYQLIYMALAVIVLAIIFVLYASRGTLLTLCIIVWALSSYVCGHYSASLFVHYTAINPGLGGDWIRTMMFSATLFPGICCFIVWLMNFVAWYWHSSQ